MMHPMIRDARGFSQKAHGSQTYGDIYPYYKHLEDVYNVLIEFGFSEDNPQDLDLLTAAWLHDAMEDSAISYSDIKKEFGQKVAEIVYCMTDELGRNRKEKKAKTYPKIRSNKDSVVLKVADRIANVEFSATQNSGHFSMYQKEYEDFEYHLRIHGHIDNMWERLKEVTFNPKGN
jgi:guanosine-3',5'-bis(diphosphate) 3'-pyrophosphohydrolase